MAKMKEDSAENFAKILSILGRNISEYHKREVTIKKKNIICKKHGNHLNLGINSCGCFCGYAKSDIIKDLHKSCYDAQPNSHGIYWNLKGMYMRKIFNDMVKRPKKPPIGKRYTKAEKDTRAFTKYKKDMKKLKKMENKYVQEEKYEWYDENEWDELISNTNKSAEFTLTRMVGYQHSKNSKYIFKRYITKDGFLLREYNEYNCKDFDKWNINFSGDYGLRKIKNDYSVTRNENLLHDDIMESKIEHIRNIRIRPITDNDYAKKNLHFKTIGDIIDFEKVFIYRPPVFDQFNRYFEGIDYQLDFRYDHGQNTSYYENLNKYEYSDDLHKTLLKYDEYYQQYHNSRELIDIRLNSYKEWYNDTKYNRDADDYDSDDEEYHNKIADRHVLEEDDFENYMYED